LQAVEDFVAGTDFGEFWGSTERGMYASWGQLSQICFYFLVLLESVKLEFETMGSLNI
jgi:hypothetical protein